MMILAALVLAGSPIEEAEHALAAGRTEQAGRMVRQLVAGGEKGERIDRLRASTAAAAGRNDEAFALFAELARKDPADPSLAYGAARAAYLLDRVAEARRWSSLATSRPNAGWREWNLCGVIGDRQGEFARSDECYARALQLAPGRAEVLNNQGWSLLLRGEWKGAAERLQQALAADPGSRIARKNLELAEAASAERLPVRRAGETLDSYAARLNDAGVIAEAAGDRKRAIAAFAQAVSLHPKWSETAARNLAHAEGR